MTKPPPLNYDVMTEILRQCASTAPSLLVAMMQASRDLYTDGFAHKLLLELDIPITSPQQLQSYLACVSANDGARVRFAKSLHLAFPHATRTELLAGPSRSSIPDDLLARLVDVLPTFSHLERLHILRPDSLQYGGGSATPDAMVDAIAGLSNVRYLLLDDPLEWDLQRPWFSFTANVLSKLRSSLVSLTIVCNDILSCKACSSPQILFTNSLHSLRSLTIHHAKFRYDPENPLVIPQVEELDIKHNIFQYTDLDMRPWSQYFPNVKRLRFHVTPRAGLFETTSYDARTRETNLAYSRQGLVKWSSLDWMITSPGSAWCSALCATKVGTLVIYGLPPSYSADTDELQLLPTVLEDVSPGTVEIRIDSYESKLFEALRPVLQHSAWHGVRQLVLRLFWQYDCPSTLILHTGMVLQLPLSPFITKFTLRFNKIKLAEDELSAQGWNVQLILKYLLSCHLSLERADVNLFFDLGSGTLVKQRTCLRRSEWDILMAQEAQRNAQDSQNNVQEVRRDAASRQCYARCCTM